MTDVPGLTSENAAVFGYGLVLSRSGADISAAVRARLAEHRTYRDRAEALWPDTAPAPVGYVAADDLPQNPVEMAIRLESDCCEGWRQQIGTATSEDQRRLCVESLTGAAVSLARWRTLIPGTPFEVLPGFPRD